MSQGNTDNDYNSDDEIFYEDDEIFYESDEVSATKYNIILCELFNELIHGKSNSVVVKHYLNICSLKDLDIQVINEMCNMYNSEYTQRMHRITPHKFIKNYANIITSSNYIKPEIGENIQLESGHCVSIIKTIWIKLIQRTWKKIYKMKKDVIQKRQTITSINHRKIKGTWPDNCRYLPTLKGMLNKLSK
jgi:hypothetical protein